MNFKDTLAADRDVFLCSDEFAEEHELNGLRCKCVVQSPTAQEMFAKGVTYDGYEGISGKVVIVHVKTDDLQEIPQEGQVFTLDDEPMLVFACVEDLGMLSITLHQNVGATGGDTLWD